MAAPELDSAEGIEIGNVLIHAGDVDGRDVSVDGSKLDSVATNATKYPDTGEQAFLDADHTKLDNLTKNVVVKVISDDSVLTVGDGKTHFTIPIELNGMNLVSVGAHVYTPSTSGTPTFQIHNATDASNMLSTAITIDVSENDSMTAGTAPVINSSEDDVVTGDVIRLDCDVAGTSTRGMEIRMGFR